MADYNIIELVMYGIIAYLGVGVLIISVITNPPTEKSLAGARSIWLTPSILCMALLMFSSGYVSYDVVTSTIVTSSNATSDVWTETREDVTSFNLVNPIWGMVHGAMFFILIIYVLIQIFTILTKL